MNLLLLEKHQIDDCHAVLSDLQTQHLQKVLRLSVGDTLRVGVVNGNMGEARLTQLQPRAHLDIIALNTPPPSQLALTLILALPRPQMIKRILQTVACMGVQRLCLLQTAKVEKNFWQSPSVSDTAIREHLILGLEQGVATQLPHVEKHTRWRPFVQDELPSLAAHSHNLIAHPGNYPYCTKMPRDQQTILAVGPEGGFTEQEVEWFVGAGFSPIQLGARILKVETAVTALLAKLSI